MLWPNVCEQLNQEMIILLRSSPFSIVCSRILELNSLEDRFGCRLVRIGTKSLGIVKATSRPESAISTVQCMFSRWSWTQRYPRWPLLWALISFWGVLNKFDGFSVSPIHDCCYRHGKSVHLCPRDSMLVKMYIAGRKGGENGV